MKRINTYTTALLLTVALAGCSREVESPERPLIDGQIRISSQIKGDATDREIVQSSRAIVETGTALTDMRFLRKDAATATPQASYAGATLLLANRLTSGEIVFTGTVPMYNKNDQHAMFVAYWPAGTRSIDSGIEKVEWTIDGKTDILLSSQYSAGTLSVPYTGTMTLHHQLAQLEIVCKADPAATPAQVANTWGKITKIEVTATLSKLVYSYAEPGSTFPNGDYVSLALLKPDYQTDFAPIDIPANANTTANAVAMLVPNTSNVTGSKIPLRITTERQGVIEITTSLQNSAKFEKGMRHTVPLIFKWDGKIELGNSTIAEWNDGGTNLNPNPIAKGKPIIEYGIPPYDITTGTSLTGVTYTLSGSTLLGYNNYTLDNNGLPKGDVETSVSEPPYAKLEIATEDEKSKLNAAAMTWNDAWTACKEKTTGGSGWRLPRSSELCLIYLNREALNRCPKFTALDKDMSDWRYWSATEYNSTNYSWCSIAIPGMVITSPKTESHHVRCVREVPLDPVIMEYGKQPYSTIQGEVYNAGNRFTTTQKGYTTSSYNSYIKGSTDASQNGGYRKDLDECLNEVPYRRLEIEKYDENVPGVIPNSYVMNWSTAWDVCKNKKNGGGGWRLPRMSELMWMYHNRVALSSTPYFVALDVNAQYWSGTESSMYEMWLIAISSAEILSLSSNAQFNVRCVREVPIEPVIVEYGKAPNGNILSGTLSGMSYTMYGAKTSSYNGYTYNAANADNNGGYKAGRETCLQSEYPYAKFELAKEYEHSGKIMTWQEAWDLCKMKAPVGEWRLPRASEMVLVALNQSALLSLPYFDSFNYSIWCGTEATNIDSATSEHFAFYYNGTYLVDPVTKTHSRRVRCVRELK